MRIAIINSVCGSGSTGRICVAISKRATDNGDDSFVFYGLGHSAYIRSVRISNRLDYLIHNALSRIFDAEGLFSIIHSFLFIRKLKRFNPDIIHIHNLHGHYINYRMLFSYIRKKQDCRVIMTLHDCWSFTGHCAHFDNIGCDRWKKGCITCPHKNTYPCSLVSFSKRNYSYKQHDIASLKTRLFLVPVSKWLDSFLPDSLYKEIPHLVIHNGIDLSLFQYTESRSFLDHQGITSPYVLGVANPWSSYKGLGDMIKLRDYLDKSVLIVLVGLSDDQMSSLPSGIRGIQVIRNITTLVELYSSALALINTTYCDNYPTVNLESIACGTPVITYNTGGSPESISPETGIVVQKGDVKALVDSINVLKSRPRDLVRFKCRAFAETHFNQENCFQEYVRLYHSVFDCTHSVLT